MAKKDVFYEHYKQFMGQAVVGICHDVEGGMYGLKFRDKKKKETIAWIQCDPEGNGPGFLQVDD